MTSSQVQPLISVIIPCFNAELTVERAIRSALNQTYAPTEVIVVDDGSTDSSLNIIQAFERDVRVHSGPNLGGCVARNTGLRLASGEFIQFLDADDELLPTKLEQQVCFSSDADFVLSRGGRYVDGVRTGTLGRTYCDTFFEMACLDLITILGPLIRKSCIQKVGGFRPELVCGQERDLFFRMACETNCRVISPLREDLFKVHVTENSVSSNLERSMDVYREIYLKMYEAKKETLDEVQRLAIADSMMQGAVYYVRAGCYGKAREYASIARRIDSRVGRRQPRKLRMLQYWLGVVAGSFVYQRLF